MTWDEYYDNYYDWAESTRIKKLSSVDVLGDTEEASEVMLDLAFNHDDIVLNDTRYFFAGRRYT